MLHTPAVDSKSPVANEKSAQAPFTFTEAVKSVQSGQSLETVLQWLLKELTKKERLALLDGDVPFWEGLRTILCDRYNREPFVHGSIPRLNIPGIRFTDGPRGVVMGASTAFPVSMSRGASWDLELEERIGKAIGVEGRAQGANYFAGVCINLPRHPAWGRIQETYSEDPLLLGDFGLALHNGVQKYLMTCVKHFALNSMENARFRVDVEVDDAALHEVYLPHFKKLIEGGVDSVMSSYNSVRGEWAGQNHELLTKILREQWKFDGFVLSDFIFGLRDAVTSVKNGLDIEAPFSQQRAMHLQKALDSGELAWSDVNIACTRILRKQLQHATRTGSSKPPMSTVFCDEHRSLSREAAAKGMVLLKNEAVAGKQLLPINPATVKKVAIIGRLANICNTGDKGSSAVFSPQVVTGFEGLQAALPGVEVLLEDSDSVEKAERLAKEVDLVISVVGYDARDEGEYVVPSFKEDPVLLTLFPPTQNEDEEDTLRLVQGEKTSKDEGAAEDGLVPGMGGDRHSLRLRSRDVEIVNAVKTANPNTIVTVVAAGPVIMEEWIDSVPAALMSWYSGSEGGHALADVLLGRVDASGRLPFSIPTDESHLPHFEIDTTKITYDRWFGQRLLDKLGKPARFPLGHGLSYSTFKTTNLKVEASPTWLAGSEEIHVHATVENTGGRRGRHIAQVYGLPGCSDFPGRVLLGYTPVDLEAGESKDVTIKASVRPLQKWQNGGGFALAGRVVGIELSSFAGDGDSLSSFISL